MCAGMVAVVMDGHRLGDQLRLTAADRAELDALLGLVDPVRDAYGCVLGAESCGRPEHVALVLGSLVVKAKGDYESVVLLTDAGHTAPAASIARDLVESAINLYYLTSLRPEAMSAETLRFGLHHDVDSVRWELAQKGLEALRAAGMWVTRRDLDCRVSAVDKLITEIERQDQKHIGLPILRAWKKGLPTSWSSLPGLAHRLAAVIADPVVVSNLWIAYRLCYTSFSGFVHGPGSIGVITRREDFDHTGSRARVGFSHTLSGHSTPLLYATLMSCELLERYSAAMPCGLKDSMTALRRLIKQTVPQPAGTETW